MYRILPSGAAIPEAEVLFNLPYFMADTPNTVTAAVSIIGKEGNTVKLWSLILRDPDTSKEYKYLLGYEDTLAALQDSAISQVFPRLSDDYSYLGEPPNIAEALKAVLEEV